MQDKPGFERWNGVGRKLQDKSDATTSLHRLVGRLDLACDGFDEADAASFSDEERRVVTIASYFAIA